MWMPLTNLVLTAPRRVIAGLLAATLAMAVGLPLMRVDTDVTNDLPQRIPAKRLYDQIDSLFPAKEMVIVAVEDPRLFTADGIARLDRLTRRLEALPTIQSVISPTNARLITATTEAIDIRAAADPLPRTDLEAGALRARLMAEPQFVGAVLSRDGNAAALLAFVKAGQREADAAEAIITLDASAREGFDLQVTGRSAATYWSKIIMGRDMGMLTSAALLIVVLLLLLTFRSLRGVVLPLAVVVASVIWTLGLMGLIGQPLTHATEILPILLIAIGVADGIHILKSYYARARGAAEAATVVRQTMADLNRPVVLTSVTTAVGFLALNTSGIDSIMALGLLTAFGVMVAMVFSLAFVPAWLVVLPLPAAGKAGTSTHFLRAERWAEAYARLLVRHRLATLGGIVAVILLAAWGATRVPAEFSNLDNFRPDHPFRVATEKVNRHFGSTTNLIVVIEGGAPDAIKEPATLAKMEALESFLATRPHVGSVQSLTGYIKQLHRATHGGGAAEYRLPRAVERERGTEWVEENGREIERVVEFDVPGKELVAQYLALFEMSGKPGDFANAVTYDYSTARINVFVDSDRASVLGELHEAVSAFIAENFGGLQAELTGMAELIRTVNELVIAGQAWSILTSLLLVFVLTALFFRSLRLGVYATLPLFFSLFFNFGFMGLTGIALNIMTMATSSIAVGVGIDYAIHFVHRYTEERRSGLDDTASAVSTLRSSGVAIFLNAMTVAAGFFALFFSEFRGVAHMGLLIALTMVTSAFAALTVLPALFVTLRPAALGGRPAVEPADV